MAKSKPQTSARSRAKDPEGRINDVRGVDRVQVVMRVRAELHAAIEQHRGLRSWSAAAHEAIEAGLVALGWKG